MRFIDTQVPVILAIKCVLIRYFPEGESHSVSVESPWDPIIICVIGFEILMKYLPSSCHICDKVIVYSDNAFAHEAISNNLEQVYAVARDGYLNGYRRCCCCS